MRIGETEFSRMPPHLQAMFRKLPNPGSDEVVGLFPQTAPSSDHTRHNGAFKSVAKGAETARRSTGPADSGSAARFFYCAKASRAERGEGNTHPTVKPIALMRYLVRLVTPPGGLVLDPFAGSGTTGIAAHMEGARAILCELSPDYAAIAEARLAEVRHGSGLFGWEGEP